MLKMVEVKYDLSNKSILITKKSFGNRNIKQDSTGQIYIKNNKDTKYRKQEKRVITKSDNCITIKEYYVEDRAKYIIYDIVNNYIKKELGYKVRLIDNIKLLFL